jgi:hypothetical protein
MDQHIIGVRQDGNVYFQHFDYKPDAPINGGGFFQNLARALRSDGGYPQASKADQVFYAMGYNPGRSDAKVDLKPEPTDHKIPVFDVDRDRVYLTEDGTPSTLICSWSSDEFYAKYA